MFVIEDELHAERVGELATRGEAVAELRRLAGLPWDEQPNIAPCTSWRTCGRRYELVEYDAAARPWQEQGRTSVLEVSRKGADWLL